MSYRMTEKVYADGQKTYTIQERAWWSPFWSDISYYDYETPDKARAALAAQLSHRVVEINVSHLEAHDPHP